MADDREWIEDVRRWCFASKQASASAAGTDGGGAGDEADALGYEAADPALQAPHWPDAPSGAMARSARLAS